MGLPKQTRTRDTNVMNEERLQEILSCFSEKRVLVVGDFYLDAYWLIDQKKSTLSLETPWYTSPVVEQHYSPGAAGTVTNNLKSLGGDGFSKIPPTRPIILSNKLWYECML